MAEHPPVAETLDQALIRPNTARVWIHRNCGGWVLFELDGGHCLTCGAAPVPVSDYHKPGDPERAARYARWSSSPRIRGIDLDNPPTATP